MDNFGLRLENLRDQAGYTKKEVSKMLGFTANVYGSYERGDRRPNPDILVKLADLFNVSLDYLLRGKGYIGESDSTKLEANFREIINLFEEEGVKKPYILEVDKWQVLDENDFKELTDHFNWVVNKAESRNQKDHKKGN